MRGEAGLHRRCNPGEGESPRIQLSPCLAERAPHPNPLPVRTGRGSTPAIATIAFPGTRRHRARCSAR
ncbi:hypothetical protein EAS61_07610 [Bradyrhizobium zhanjiangense]|uniref:Uncharacterized protein n=1 Tax=Bradyrhizobium zhanjiangense TaxID=1325107 RepID=A0A4V1KXA6_9BRAD|nr:hypothetical protein EAS61_07610 [Bradyrhizobium zhanjiangense]